MSALPTRATGDNHSTGGLGSFAGNRCVRARASTEVNFNVEDQLAERRRVLGTIPASEVGTLKLAETQRRGDIVDTDGDQLAGTTCLIRFLVDPLAGDGEPRPQDDQRARPCEGIGDGGSPFCPGRDPPIPPNCPATILQQLGDTRCRLPILLGIAEKDVNHVQPSP